ncbi:FAD-dependent oxidoreductase [Nocardia terpenica]|uniref:L-aspartate oxidase n=1 Tax=Nocardia terpenica TaxID=455432 RepID=A0A164KIP2_9NOCA|nr:FAD-binding protein [Nocardia terpenica]KZM71434.1 pyridine nucleotide-disulfide oxidoreductase [Nocardia terpenica]MBF6060881.1 FAD-dependent oxidoreductase [Nocardia terpenica]MBF6104141.1 FAD-dependent oxidoreductase [Nocardia terpenica]MBF6111485.1 FAD-dependent oxidoreductase [Nocardia terpenica]MBF6118362.1 FAD-dependent oxidoreductase [Nocardia terpenica]
MSEIAADVLVLGGGPAGVWAALAAAAEGARVVLVDKGRCGASGPTAKGIVSLWNIPPGPARDEAVRRSFEHGGQLGDPEWMHRVLAETHRRVDQLVRWGYRFPGEGAGRPARVSLDGAKYLGRLRRSLIVAGVRVLDHHPALQLRVDVEGVVSGASGVQSRNDFRTWTARAGAVVLATGGCAFLSGGAGTDVDTGDGLLMAAEAGGELSGMEFSGAYALAPVGDSRLAAVAADEVPGPGTAPAPDLALHFATLYDETGAVLGGDPFGSRAAAFAALADGRRVYAALDELPGRLGRQLSHGQARVPLRAVLEGTVRGTGGVRIVGFECATTVAGLFGAGDVATREPITGAVGGFGGQGGAWAISSGVWAGTGAARFARGRGRVGKVRSVAGAGLNPAASIDPRAVVGLVQEHTVPLRRSYWRSAGSLRDSIAELDAMWPVTEFGLGGSGPDRVRARQAAALLAVARWTKYSALARTETRGMHRRTDHPGAASDWRMRLFAGGLESVWVRPGRCEPGADRPRADLTPA